MDDSLNSKLQNQNNAPIKQLSMIQPLNTLRNIQLHGTKFFLKINTLPDGVMLIKVKFTDTIKYPSVLHLFGVWRKITGTKLGFSSFRFDRLPVRVPVKSKEDLQTFVCAFLAGGYRLNIQSTEETDSKTFLQFCEIFTFENATIEQPPA